MIWDIIDLKMCPFASFPKCSEKLKFGKSVIVAIWQVCQLTEFTLFPNLSFPIIWEMKQKDTPSVTIAWIDKLTWPNLIIIRIQMLVTQKTRDH